MIPLISRPLHAVMDYLWGITHAMAPEAMGFQDDKGANAYCKARGGGAVVTSLMTRYELGVVKVIPYNMHLALDLLRASLSVCSVPNCSVSARTSKPHRSP